MRGDGHEGPQPESDDLLMSLPEHPDDSVAAADAEDSPRDVPLPRAAYRVTAREEGHVPMAFLLAREEPDDSDDLPLGDYDDLPLGDATGRFAGRLVGDQGSFGLGRSDDTADACDDDGGYSAEESAVHIVEY